MQQGHPSLSLGGRLARPVARLWGAASSTFQKHPLLIKTVSSGFGFAFGDVLFQLGTTRRRGQAMDWRRAAAMGGAGLAVAGPLGYAFILWMEGNLMTAAPHGCGGGGGGGGGGNKRDSSTLCFDCGPCPFLPYHSSVSLYSCSCCCHLCSRLALATKLTLDQVLGLALWHAALAALHEPHRQACQQLLVPQRQPCKEKQQQRPTATNVRKAK